MGMHIQGFSDHVIPYRWVEFKKNEKIDLKLSIPALKGQNEELEPLPLTRITSLEYLFQVSLRGLLEQKKVSIPVRMEKMGFDAQTYERLGWTPLSGWVELVFRPERSLSKTLRTISSIYEFREPPVRCPRIAGAFVYLKEEMNRGLPSDLYRVRGTGRVTLCVKVHAGSEPNCPYR
jgi:hypothetical protein